MMKHTSFTPLNAPVSTDYEGLKAHDGSYDPDFVRFGLDFSQEIDEGHVLQGGI